MSLKLAAQRLLVIFSLCLFGELYHIGTLHAQLPLHAASSDGMSERSTPFHAAIEDEIEQSLPGVRTGQNPLFEAREFEQMQLADRTDYSLDEYLLSLNLFRSLAVYLRDRTYQAQAINDHVLQESAPASRVFTETSLLSALEFYAHTPLRREDVESGLKRLQSIVDVNAASAAVQPEIRFWRAEGYRALGEYSQAEQEYHEALRKSSDPRLTALTDFRLGELYERQERYAQADSSFQVVSRVQESPLALLAMLRRAAVLRSQKKYEAVLSQLDSLSVASAAATQVVRTSARDFHYTSPLVEQLTLHTTEADRIVGSAPNGGIPRTYQKSEYELSSPFLPSEIALVRGSALSELGQYEQATQVLTAGEQSIEKARDSAVGSYLHDQALFLSNALKFEEGWSLFQRQKYEDAATAFLQLAAADTARRHVLTREASAPLRDQGAYYDPFLNDTLLSSRSATLDRSVLARTTIDTSFFLYNDFPERARFYAGVALARAGKSKEAANVFVRLAQDKSVLYSDRANYQLALIRFAEHNYEARPLLEPLSYERSVTGGYASFLLGELAYRRQIYEQADRYFFNSFSNLPTTDTAIRATAHLERGLSLVVLNNWTEAADELSNYLSHTKESISGKTDEALFWLGKSYLRINKPDSARLVLDRMISSFPKSDRIVDAQYAYAWSLFQQNDFANAQRAFERVIALDSISRYSYDALARAGDSYYANADRANGNMLSANHIYNQAIDRPAFNDLRTTRALLQLGVTRMKLDSARSAMVIFDYLTRKYSKSDIVDQGYYNSALAAYAINLVDKAEQNVNIITTQFKQSSVAPRALFVAGEERVRRNDARNAIPFYQQVLRDYPRSSETAQALLNAQEALLSQKRTNEALAVADSFVAQNPTNPLNPAILIHSTELKLRYGTPQQAEATIQQYLATYTHDAGHPYAELLQGRTEAALGDTARAIAHFGQLAARYDSTDISATAYLERARLEAKQRAFDAATHDYLRLSMPQYFSSDAAPVALSEVAQLLIEQQKQDSAIIILNELAERYPVESGISARALLKASGLLLEASRYDEARAALERVTAAHPRDMLGGSAMVRVGESYNMQSQWQPAANSFIAAKRDFVVSGESEGKRLYGLAVAQSKLGSKAEAIKALHLLLEEKGVLEADRERGRTLLAELAPPKRAARKAKKGAKG